MRIIIAIMYIAFMIAYSFQYEKENTFVQQDCSNDATHYTDHVTMCFMVDNGCR